MVCMFNLIFFTYFFFLFSVMRLATKTKHRKNIKNHVIVKVCSFFEVRLMILLVLKIKCYCENLFLNIHIFNPKFHHHRPQNNHNPASTQPSKQPNTRINSTSTENPVHETTIKIKIPTRSSHLATLINRNQPTQQPPRSTTTDSINPLNSNGNIHSLKALNPHARFNQNHKL